MKKDIILLLESVVGFGNIVKEAIEHEFPKYICVYNRGYPECVEDLLCDININRIAVVCADDYMARIMSRWDGVEQIKKKGYRGPIIHIGSLPPEGRIQLYSDISSFRIEDLVLVMNKYLRS